MRSAIADLFSKSPFTPIQEHMAGVFELTSQLKPLFKAVKKGDFESAKAIYSQMTEAEARLNSLKRDVVLSLPKGIFTPTPRAGLIDLVNAQDEVADQVVSFAGKVLSREIVPHEKLAPIYKKYGRFLIESVGEVSRYVHMMDDLVTTGFQGPPVALIEEGIQSLDSLQESLRALTYKGRSRIFEHEADLNPLDALSYYRHLDRLEDLGQAVFKVGERLEAIVMY